MDYEKAYKALVAKVKNAHLYAQTDSTKNVLENILPELTESEDERIRKSLVEYFRKFKPKDMWDEMFSFGDVLSYLERQKEQKPVISDEAIRDGVVHFGITQYQIDNWLKKHINVVEQKPAEWSDEDERMLSNCVSALKEGANGHAIVIDYGEHEKWLKSLPERFNLQSKQEWSEEDEHYFQNLIMAVDSTFSDGNTKNWLQNRLKSLRPQPHWKPSEEQIKELLNALIPGKDFDCDILAELYKQLKKL